MGINQNDNGKAGSSILESAMIWPLVIFMCVSVITTAVKLTDAAGKMSDAHKKEVAEMQKDGLLDPEDMLRIKWLSKKE